MSNVSSQVPDIFVGHMDDVRYILNTLSPLSTKKDANVNVNISSSGFRIHFEDNLGGLSGTATIPFDTWTGFRYDQSQEEEFGVKIYPLVECLSLYGNNPDPNSSTKLQMSTAGSGNDLVLLLENSRDVFSECRIKSQLAESIKLVNFRQHAIHVKIIFKSEFLREMFNELDWSLTHLTWSISDQAPNIRLETAGSTGTGEVEYPCTGLDGIESFDIKQPTKFKYKMKLIQQALKGPLNVAQKSQVRINAIGILEFQHLIMHSESKRSFLTYFIKPEEDDEAQ